MAQVTLKAKKIVMQENDGRMSEAYLLDQILYEGKEYALVKDSQEHLIFYELIQAGDNTTSYAINDMELIKKLASEFDKRNNTNLAGIDK